MNEASSSPDALDERIDAALRRRFAAPASLETLAARSLPGRRARHVPRLAIAASIAASLFLWFWVNRGPDEPRERPVEVASTTAPLRADLPFCRLVGPLLEGQPEPGLIRSPDLARLYHDMESCQGAASTAACGLDDQLAERLSATYGQTLAIRPEAAGRLHGPFGSDEWPTATIVTGTSDDRTAVLVADRDATLACCVQIELPEGSGLHTFFLSVGEVVLTEITPLSEPRLLPYFE
jgi:hypothetical protein